MKVSFIHGGGPGMASFRYRAAIPALELGLPINEPQGADVLVFSKPMEQDLPLLRAARGGGIIVIADFCDDHFERFDWYDEFRRRADAITTPTIEMARLVTASTPSRHAPVTVIPDPYELPELPPHCTSEGKLLWFGNRTNLSSLERVLPQLVGKRLTVISNAQRCIPWSMEAMLQRLPLADIVLLPATAKYKSCNRAVEAIRQGCFVVAEPHPSLDVFCSSIEPSIWIGNIKEGVEWATQNPKEANQRTLEAQKVVRSAFSPRTLASAWRSLFETVKLRSISEVVEFAGQAGSASMASMRPQT